MAVIVNLDEATQLKQHLKEELFYDRSRRCKRHPDTSTLVIPVNTKFYTSVNIKIGNVESLNWKNIQISTTNEPLDEDTKCNLTEQLELCIKKLNNKNLWFEELKKDLPKSYERYGDVLLVPSKSLNHHFWNDIDNLKILAESFKCKRIAKKGSISKDKFRTPQVTMILGSDGFVQHTDNKIIYKYDIRKCMYSPGNITEKIRLSRIDCSDEVVVDLYAGIGYFTLPILVHGKASLVYACEWNPDAIEALKENLRLNKVEDRCIVLEGDNKQTCPVDVADRVNLGLIPSSRDGWVVACRALKKDKTGILHIHENVNDGKIKNGDNFDHGNDNVSNNDEDDLTEDVVKSFSEEVQITKYKPTWVKWAGGVCREINRTLQTVHPDITWHCRVMHIGHIKSYAPHVDHMVVDVECGPHRV